LASQISIHPGRQIQAVTIKTLKHGPYEVAGGAKLIDVNGKE